LSPNIGVGYGKFNDYGKGNSNGFGDVDCLGYGHCYSKAG
jgi:hypothetical protein